MKNKYIWVAVEADEYELPLAVADTARELGAIFGISQDSVKESAHMHRDGRISGRKFMKVRRED